MKKIFSRWLPCLTLTAWSAVLLFFFFSGRINSLLHPTFRPFTLVAGVVLLLLAACFVFFPVSLEACADDDFSRKTFGRKNTGRVLTFLILLVPICAAATFSTNSYGLSTMLNRGVVDDASGLASKTKPAPNVEKTSAYVEPPLPTQDGSQPQPQAQTQQNAPSPTDEIPRSKDGNIIVQVVDLLYAAQDTSLRDDLKNKKLELIGQLMPDNVSNASGKRFKLVRMFMVCCAADARPVSVLVESDQKPKGDEMAWMKVVGTVDFPIENGRPVAIFKADKVQQTEPPEETMLY
jgi:uncharacterized repeat protein (TIGR03943 family)